MAWVSPTGHNDPDNKWSNETQAYDDKIVLKANVDNIPGDTWSSFLELTIAAINCDKIRFYGDYTATTINAIDVDVYYDGGWHDVYEGAFTDEIWEEKSLSSTHLVTAARVAFYNDSTFAKNGYLYEFDFNEFEAGEEKLLTATCSATSSTIGSLTVGKIESLTATSATATNVPSTTLQLLYSITAHAPPTTSVTGSLSIVKSLAGTSSAASSTQGSLTVGKLETLTATSVATSIATGSLTLGKVETLTGTATAQSSTTAQLCVLWVLSATSGAVSIITGSLTVINLVKLMKKLIQLEEIEV